MKSTDGSRRNSPLTIALLRSASPRKRTFTTGEPCADPPECARISREDWPEGVASHAWRRPTSPPGESNRHRGCLVGEVMRDGSVDFFELKNLEILTDSFGGFATAERMDNGIERDAGTCNVVVAVALLDVFLRHLVLLYCWEDAV